MSVVTVTGKITRIFVDTAGNVNLRIDGNDDYRRLRAGTTNFEESYKLILLAAGYRQEIKLRMEGSNSRMIQYVYMDW